MANDSIEQVNEQVSNEQANNILSDVKKQLNADFGDSYDSELLLFINSVIGTLIQIGVGPDEGVTIDASSTWDSIIGNDKRLNSVKTYVALKVKKIFDPPENQAVKQSLEEQIKELEYRIFVTKDLDRINSKSSS